MESDKEAKKNSEDKTIPGKITLKEALQIGYENKKFHRHLRSIKNQSKGMKVIDDPKREIFSIPSEPVHNLESEHSIKTNREIIKDTKIGSKKEETLSNNQTEIIYKKSKKRSIKNKKITTKKNFRCLIILIISIASILVGLGIGLYFVFKNKNSTSDDSTISPDSPVIHVPPEKLVSSLTYQENQIMKFQNFKISRRLKLIMNSII